MMAATHRLGGIAFGMATAEFMLQGEQNWILSAAMVGGSVLGSLLPDIDNSKSAISRKIPIVSLVVTIFQTIVRGIATLLPGKEEKHLRGVIGHRGITHSLSMVAIITTLIFMLLKISGASGQEFYFFSIGLPVGMLSHIILDMFAGGVPLFCPITNKRITLAHIKTGGAVEWVLRITAILVFVVILKNH